MENDGFIHCSDIDQVIEVADNLFEGEKDLVILCIDEERVDPELVYEDCYDSGEEYPHIYGPIDTDAVLEVYKFERNKEGGFKLPDELARVEK